MRADSDTAELFSPAAWHRSGGGARYLQLYRHLAAAIGSGRLGPDQQLPPERDLAEMADVSRVTVRKAVARLAEEGLIVQRRGAGSFVRAGPPRLEQSLSSLVSFTENMRARGKTSTSAVLSQGLFVPSPDEQMVLGLSAGRRVARLERLRSADGVPMALENSALPEDILPNPAVVGVSLYQVLRADGRAPTRAIQRVSAVNLGAEEARRLGMAEGAAALRIDRTGYLDSGRPIEFTRGLYRSDIYDFVTELRLE
ncbi:MAG: UTRA domain-containing protein [Limimaricola sp.]|uniref:GntR family transcriptional regulator n=1 Tax=Limimaricola sp. TaxID=2211665 RepID=UPI001DC33DAD|nr:GntR family transcriptional regulator [Limimaricola sp.]MBI1416574.1 UTRA domain-containing protein [Limimaricola sp.]